MLKILAKLFAAVCIVLLNAPTGFASSNETAIAEGADLTGIKRVVICQPVYTETGDITSEDLLESICTQGQRLKLDTVTEKIVQREILKSSNIDVAAMAETDAKQAKEAFFKELPKYADAYIVPTVIHNSRVVLFFEVYSAESNKRIYTSQVVASRNMADNMETYELMTKRFYRDFLNDIEAQQKDKK